MSGIVYLVGAGPGDPGLLTQKGADCLKKAEVVVYDYLANPELLALAPASAERIYVGKKGGDHTKTQEQINGLLCDLAASGKIVTRLKGGDPYVFGRGGEEASALHERGLAFEVVPGVTSAIAAPSYAGIPVTDRRATTEVAFITGHEDPTKPGSTINWASLAGIGTLVFLMGVKNLPHICDQLMAHGKPADTPAAAVRWGTTPRQWTISGTLADLPDKVKKAGLKAPAITVVGKVVSLRDELRWFEDLPLFGKRIVVTRTREQASQLSAQLRELGAEVLEIPTIAVQPPADPEPLAKACANIEAYDWLVFTSPNGVSAFFAALDEAGKDCRSLFKAKVAAIGPATGKAVAKRGVKPDVVARTFVAEGLLEALADYDLEGAKVLLPRAAQAREVLPETLASRGAQVEVAPAYETVAPEGSADALKQAMADGFDAATFTSSSTVTNFLALLEQADRDELIRRSQAGETALASIGPITSQTARDAGLEVKVEPGAYTIDDLVKALASHFAQFPQA
jgi:uroporphyrinogen III methyltransferase/synthase